MALLRTVASSRIFTRSASKKTKGYIGSSGRLCHAVTSATTASVTVLLRSGETSTAYISARKRQRPLTDQLVEKLVGHRGQWCIRRQRLASSGHRRSSSYAPHTKSTPSPLSWTISKPSSLPPNTSSSAD